MASGLSDWRAVAVGAEQLRKSHVPKMNIIEAVGVTKSFYIGELHVDAVRGIDLAVRKGELLAIVGPSGSGKSTLLNLLGAIETPTTGHVLLENVDVATLND